MKYVNQLFFALGLFFIYSCEKVAFDGKYVKGVVMSEAICPLVPVMIYLKDDVESQYVAFYEKSPDQYFHKYDTIFGKGFYRHEGLVILREITKRQPQEIYEFIPETAVDAHCFSNHGNIAAWHKRGHYAKPIPINEKFNNSFTTTSNFQFGVYRSLTNLSVIDTLTAIPSLIDSFINFNRDNVTEVFYQVDNTGVINEISRVHKHF